MRRGWKHRPHLPVYVKHPRIYDGTPPGPVDYAPIVNVEGYLERLLELPLEIFAEVCAFLEPLDLRNLSISGGTFRRILMSRDSRSIWAGARIRLYGPMPDPPEVMSEPEYARFLFSPECYTCDSLATKIDCFDAIKSCSTCYTESCVNYREATLLYQGLQTPGRYIWGALSHQTKPYHRETIRTDFLCLTNNNNEGSEAEYEALLEERCRSIGESADVIQTWMENEDARQQKIRYERVEKYFCRPTGGTGGCY